jgi:hypothetical protein
MPNRAITRLPGAKALPVSSKEKLVDFPAMSESAQPIPIAFGLKLLGAIAAYIVGRMLIGFAPNLVIRVLDAEITGARLRNALVVVVAHPAAMRSSLSLPPHSSQDVQRGR